MQILHSYLIHEYVTYRCENTQGAFTTNIKTLEPVSLRHYPAESCLACFSMASLRSLLFGISESDRL